MALVTLNPGDDVGAIVASGTAGSTYTFSPGTYRQQSIAPKTGDIFQAATLGTVILTGARILSSWTYDGAGHWYATGQTQANTFNPSFTCQAGHEGGQLPEQLWVDGVLHEHMTTLGAVSSTKWYFDYAADRIYIGTDPAGHVVETSVTETAFRSNAPNVVIRRLVIEKYAGAAQLGAIHGNTGWNVDGNEVRYCHGVGIKVGGNSSIIQNNKVHHIGQLGLGQSGMNCKMLNNEVYETNLCFYGGGVFAEAGGCKVAVSTDALIKGNFFHHNHAVGLWVDVNDIRAVVEYNIVEDNDWRGIMTEVDYGTIIRFNQCRRNGFAPLAGTSAFGSGILVSSSRDVEVYNNVVENNAQGIIAMETNRTVEGPAPPPGYGSHDVINLYVHDNTVVQPTGRAGGALDFDPNADPYTAAANNRWRNNFYTLGVAARFYWNNAEQTQAQWNALGQDGATTGEPPTLPPPAPDPDPPAPTPPPTQPPPASTGAVRGVFDPPPKILSSRLGDVYYISEDRALTPMDGVGTLPEMTGHFPQLQVDGTWRVDPPVYCRRTRGRCQVSPGTTTLLTTGIAAPTSSGTTANVDGDEGPFIKYTTTSSLGNTAGLVTAFAVSRRAWDPNWTAVIQTTATVDDLGLWIGYFSGSPDNDADPVVHLAAFRYYTDTDDTAFWTTVTKDASESTETVTEVAVAVDTTYRLRVRMLEGAVVFFIDDVPVATHATTLPDESEPLGWGVRVTTLAAATAALALSRVEFTQL